MALKDGFRIKETSTTTGAGTLTLAGAPATYLTFLAEIGEGNEVLYALFDADGINWEVGKGVVSTNTLTRASIIRSSNADAALVLTAGTHTLVNAPVPGRATGDVDFDHSQLSNVHLNSFIESLTAPAIAAGVLDLNVAHSNTFNVSLTENVTSLTFTGIHTGVAESITLVLVQDATGGRTFAFPASIKWAGGSAPILSSGANETDVLTFITTDSGVTWYGMLAGAAFA